jgi:hypothetical protein
MKAPDVLKQAVLEQDWLLVCKVYTAITGEPLEPPKPKEVDLFDIDIPMDSDFLGDMPDIADEEYDLEPGYEVLHEKLPAPAEDVAGEGDWVELDDGEEEDDEEEAKMREENADFMTTTKKDDEEDALQGSKARKERFRVPKDGKRRPNQFKDDLRLHSRQRADKHSKDKDGSPLAVAAPRPRGGERDAELGEDTGGKVDVECSLCGKKERVSDRLAVGYHLEPEMNTYKCNKCCTGRGRRKLRDDDNPRRRRS